MRTLPYHKFYSRVRASALKKRAPLRVMFELTYRCNFSCGHCYIPGAYRTKGELGLAQVKGILSQLAEAGCLFAGFTGGEPMMRKDFFRIISHARRLGMETVVYTNGSLIDRKAADEFSRLRVNKVDITIPALSPGRFAAVTGVQGHDARVFEGIRMLKERGVPLGFKACVLKENASEIPGIRKFAASLGTECRIDDMLQSSLDGSLSPYRYAADRRKPGARPQGICGDTPATDAGIFECGAGHTQCVITPQGKLKVCLLIEYPLLSVTAGRFAGAWKKAGEGLDRLAQDGAHDCRGCRLRPQCKWCPARGWLYSGDLTSRDPRCCSFAAGKGREEGTAR